MSETTEQLTKRMDSMDARMEKVVTSAESMLAGVEQMVNYTRSLTDNMDVLKAITQNMNSTTGKMLTLTRTMSTNTNQLLDQTTTMVQTAQGLSEMTRNMSANVRQGASKQVRDKATDGIKVAQRLDGKVGYAGAYLESFEFQLWTGDGQDTLEHRDALFLEAAQEFTRALNEAVRAAPQTADFTGITDAFFDTLNADNPMPMIGRDRLNDLYSLAISLDEVNRVQLKVIAESKKKHDKELKAAKTSPVRDALEKVTPIVERVSMLTLVENALRANAKLERGEITLNDLKPYEQEILLYEKDMRFLLQARANILPGCLLSQISGVDKKGVGKYAEMASIWMNDWTPDTRTLNLALIKKLQIAMTEAKRAHWILWSTGGPKTGKPVLAAPLVEVFDNMLPLQPRSTVSLAGAALVATAKFNEELDSLQDRVDAFKKLR